MAGRVDFSVDKAASPHHVLLGQYRERCEDTNLCCGYSILSGSHCRARLRTQKVHFQRPQSDKQGADRQDSCQRPFQWP